MLGHALDHYERRARLLPALLVGLPILGLLVALGVRQYPVLTLLVSLVVAAGGPVVITTLVRELGKDLESKLWAHGGGPPTTRLLRSDGPEPGRRARRRTLVERLTGESLPTVEDEHDDSEAAHDRYQQAVAEARAATGSRDTYPVLQAENVAYGFSRNTLALRPWGVGAAVIALVGSVAATASATVGDVPYGWIELAAAGLLAVGMLAFWTRYPTETRVRAAADRYAARLFDAAADAAR